MPLAAQDLADIARHDRSVRSIHDLLNELGNAWCCVAVPHFLGRGRLLCVWLIGKLGGEEVHDRPPFGGGPLSVRECLLRLALFARQVHPVP